MLSNVGIFRGLTAFFVALLFVIAGCESAPETVSVSETEEIAGTVTAIDQATRTFTVRGPQGNSATFTAGPEVRNLAQVSVGDTMRIAYEQAYVATLKESEAVSADVPMSVGAARTEEGDSPGVAVGAMLTMDVEIVSVGENGDTVTFTGPSGQLEAINVRFEESKEFVRGLNPGDIVEITYAQALAVTISPE